MGKLNLWVVGTALALTLAIVYAACATAYALWPDGTLAFINSWFHGLDLRLLQSAAKPITWGAFFVGLSSIVATGFWIGVIYAGMYNLVGRCPGCR